MFATRAADHSDESIKDFGGQIVANLDEGIRLGYEMV